MSWEDEDYMDEDWVDDEGDDEDDLLICPSCRAEVHEDTQQCPHCGDWITPAYPSETIKQWIWKIAALLIILSFLLIAFL